ncbi:MAG: glycosyl transferase family 2 [Rhodobacteraceae bacterium]|nr:MAG: glycosyl transferase family 2 [Paracoccaceae bacterium]
MGVWSRYKLRIERRRRRIRSIRKRRELSCVIDRSAQIQKTDIILFCTLRNEKPRLAFFLDYYRKMGVSHFFFVDNGSIDGSCEFLAEQADTSVWKTNKSYKRSGFGVDWLNGLKSKYAHGHWVLVVDVDEFFVYPHSDTRPLSALTDWLDVSGSKSFGALLVDMYPKGEIKNAVCGEGKNPMSIAPFFDSGNYIVQKNPKYRNLWIQGGVRQRVFFKDKPNLAPSLNKIPLVKWSRKNVFVSSTHTILPQGLNVVYNENGGQKACGCLMHTKFLSSFSDKVDEELVRNEHYSKSREYKAYAQSNKKMWTKFSVRYKNWQQLEELGLLSRGGWA